MGPELLADILSGECREGIQTLRDTLGPYHLKKVDEYQPWTEARERILSNENDNINVKHLSIGYVERFFDVFAAKWRAEMDMTFFWGVLGHLLDLGSEEPQETARRIGTQIRQLAILAETPCETLKKVTSTTHGVGNICVRMHLLYLDFFVAAIASLSCGRIRSVSLNFLPNILTPQKRDLDMLYSVTHEKLKVEVAELQGACDQSRWMFNPTTMSGTPRLTLVPRFSQNTPYDREDILVKLDQLISPKGAHSARSVVLHGIPEIGKTTVAAGYATKKFEYGIYDFVLWVQGQNSVSIAQSFTKIAHRLDLNGADAKSHDHNHYLVQKWLQSQGAPVLIVFDQVKSLESIEPYWPASGRETVIITTHESRLAFKDIEHDILVNRWDNETGSEFLLKQLQKNEHFEADTASAVALSETMGGHPALLTACATYVVEAKISLAEYRNLKPWNNLKTEAARESSTWALIFDQFSEDSQHLMATLCYLDPRIDPSKLLRENGSKNFPYHLDFCNHESEFSDALHKPKALGFIKASQDGGTLVIETSVQTCLRKIFPLECRQKSFNTAAELLVGVFPDRELAESQLYNKWEICNTYLRHVMHLKECFDKEMAISKEFKAPREFCILLEIAQRFLSETNNMKECMNLCQANLRALKRLGQDPEQADFEAAILSHQAQATESLGDPEKAIELNKEVYNIRLKQEQVQKPGNSTAELKTAKTRLAKVANNVGYCCDTANIHEEAKKWFIKSEEIWTSMINDKLEEQPRPARHVANHARCLTYLRNFDEEVESKFKMAIIELQNEDPINQAMLAYALFGRATLLRKQSKFKEAKEQYFGARSAWQKLDGTGFHPFSAACGYRLGTCCLRLEEFRAAISHLEESCEQSKVWKADRPVEHARGLLMLSEALEADSTSTQADRDAHKRDAEALLRNAHIDPMQDNIVDACDDRVPIFWR